MADFGAGEENSCSAGDFLSLGRGLGDIEIVCLKCPVIGQFGYGFTYCSVDPLPPIRLKRSK